MRYGILACIHANFPALQAVLRDAEGQGCTHLACCGDVVGYGAQPKECLDMIRDLKIPCVKGSHDESCSCDDTLEGFNPHAAANVAWQREQLTEQDKEWLRSLKLVEQVARFTITHGSLNDPGRWLYIFDRVAASRSFEHQARDICFFGHTHVPVAFIRSDVVCGGTYSKFKVQPARKYLVNVGSVGQPRDGNPKAAYAIYDLDERSIELRRVDFGGSAQTPPPAPTPMLVR